MTSIFVGRHIFNNCWQHKHDSPGGHGMHSASKAVLYLKFSRWGTNVPVGQGDLYDSFPAANPASVRAINRPFWFVTIPSSTLSGELGKKKRRKMLLFFLYKNVLTITPPPSGLLHLNGMLVHRRLPCRRFFWHCTGPIWSWDKEATISSIWLYGWNRKPLTCTS